MSIQALPTPTAAPAVAGASACLTDAHAVALDHIHRDELGTLLETLAVIESQTEALKLAVLAEAERRQVAADTAATGTDTWAAALTGETREVNAGGVHLAQLLQTKYHHTRTAYAAGQLRTAQVRVIVRAAEQAPLDATPDQLAVAEEILVNKATGVGTRTGRPMNAKRLRQAARRMFDPVDRDLADRHEAIMLGRESRRARHETYLALHDNGDGTYSGKFTIPELHGALLTHTLDQLTSPRRLTTAEDELDDLLTDLQEHREETGTATLTTGPATTITAADARRLACEAGLIPAVLGGASQPLDLGRTRRLHSPAQRRALALTHDTCAITTCERPFAWTEIHHPVPWSHGGRTDLDNAVPLCAHHHHRAHEPGWELTHHDEHGWRLRPRR